MVVAGAVTIASVSLSIGMGIGRSQTPSDEDLEKRVSCLEKAYERWDERWINLQSWMARIDAKLTQMEEH
jgi:hypothetical protein